GVVGLSAQAVCNRTFRPATSASPGRPTQVRAWRPDRGRGDSPSIVAKSGAQWLLGSSSDHPRGFPIGLLASRSCRDSRRAWKAATRIAQRGRDGLRDGAKKNRAVGLTSTLSLGAKMNCERGRTMDHEMEAVFKSWVENAERKWHQFDHNPALSELVYF